MDALDDAPPFSMKIQLADIALDCGALTLEAYLAAPGGASGRVLFGTWKGRRIAVKIIAARPGVPAAKSHEAFMGEAENMLAVRELMSRARTLERVGASLLEECRLPVAGRRCRESHDLRGYRHLIYIYGVGTVPDLSAIAPVLPPGPAHLVVMEPLTGGSLKEPPHSPHVAQRAPAELSAGLAALAAAHIVHADVKPENIMLRTPGGELVLTDYGVGRISNGGADESEYIEADAAHGTKLYLAPELLDGKHANTFASDMCGGGGRV